MDGIPITGRYNGPSKRDCFECPSSCKTVHLPLTLLTNTTIPSEIPLLNSLRLTTSTLPWDCMLENFPDHTMHSTNPTMNCGSSHNIFRILLNVPMVQYLFIAHVTMGNVLTVIVHIDSGQYLYSLESTCINIKYPVIEYPTTKFSLAKSFFHINLFKSNHECSPSGLSLFHKRIQEALETRSIQFRLYSRAVNPMLFQWGRPMGESFETLQFPGKRLTVLPVLPEAPFTLNL